MVEGGRVVCQDGEVTGPPGNRGSSCKHAHKDLSLQLWRYTIIKPIKGETELCSGDIQSTFVLIVLETVSQSSLIECHCKYSNWSSEIVLKGCIRFTQSQLGPQTVRLQPYLRQMLSHRRNGDDGLKLLTKQTDGILLQLVIFNRSQTCFYQSSTSKLTSSVWWRNKTPSRVLILVCWNF